MKLDCAKNVEIQDIADVPIDNIESVPDYFITERDITEPSTGNIVRSFTRTPGAKILPNGTLDNVVAFEANNTGLTIPENQVRGVRVVNTGSSNAIQYADVDHAPMMIAIGKTAGELVLCQNCGFINIPNGHAYSVGLQYYVGEDGEPTTDSTSGYKLFIPVSNTRLAVNMG